MAEKPKVKLEDWRVVNKSKVQGKAFGHPNFKDGDLVTFTMSNTANYKKGDKIDTKLVTFQLGEKGA